MGEAKGKYAGSAKVKAVLLERGSKGVLKGASTRRLEKGRAKGDFKAVLRLFRGGHLHTLLDKGSLREIQVGFVRRSGFKR